MIKVINFFKDHSLINLSGILLLRSLGESVYKNFARSSQNFFLIQMSALLIYKYQGLDSNDKDFLVNKPIIFRPDKYVGLDLI